jgi:hypothetical protein
MDDMYVCPNIKCPVHDIYKQYYSCSKCGTAMVKVTSQEYLNISSAKQREKTTTYREQKTANKMLISDQMTDEEIKKHIQEDMVNLAMHESGTGWMRLGTILSMNSTDQMLGAGFKALIDQNKIIIRQNELILRALRQQPPPP